MGPVLSRAACELATASCWRQKLVFDARAGLQFPWPNIAVDSVTRNAA